MQILRLNCCRVIMNFLNITLIIFIFLFLKSSFCWSAFYQINSETVRLPKATGLQADLKILAGLEDSNPHFLDSIFKRNRIAIGAYSLYQSDQDPTYFLRYGPVVQLRTEVFFNHLYLQYEYHTYQYQSSYSNQYVSLTENRYGLFYSRYDNLWSSYDLDSYAESFYIPNVSRSNFLSVLRLTVLDENFLILNLNPFAEIYLKDSPQLFGGKRQEFRLGLQYRPIEAISVKIMGNLLPTSDTSSAGLLFQINLFKEGSL